MTTTKARKPNKETLKLGEVTHYRGYSILHEGKREFRISIYSNGLSDAKKVIDWMIRQGCIKEEEQT